MRTMSARYMKGEIETLDHRPETRKFAVDKTIYNYLVTSCTQALKAIGFTRRLTTVIEGDDMFVCGKYDEDNAATWDGFLALYENTKENMVQETFQVPEELLEGDFLNDLQSQFNCIIAHAPDDRLSIVVTCTGDIVDKIWEFTRQFIPEKHEQSTSSESPTIEEKTVEESREIVEDTFPPTGYDVGGIYSVYLRATSMTSLKVDAITSLVNRRLEQASDVTRNIFDRAGPEVREECRSVVSKRNNIPVGSVIKTTSGKLPCKFIFHAVAPKWNPFYGASKDKECCNLLETTLQNVLKKIDKERISSLAIPPISSGKYRVPHTEVANVIFSTIIERAAKLSPRPDDQRRSIHIVDINDSMLKLVKKLFDDVIETQGRHVIVVPLPEEEVVEAFVRSRST